MKKTIITMLVLAGAAMAETTDLTWVGTEGGKWYNTNNWVVTGTEDHPTSLPGWNTSSANTDEFIFRIGDGAKVNANNESIGYLNGKLVIGDNVTFGTNWAAVFKDVVIGKNFTWQNGGDGLKFAVNSGYTVSQDSTANTLTINSTYTGYNILSTLGTGSTVDFGTEGKVVSGANVQGQTCLGQYSAGEVRPLTLSAQIEYAVTEDKEKAGIQERLLIEAPSIWYRDINGAYRDSAFGLTLTLADGTELVKYDSVMDTNAAWTLNGVVVATEDLQAGAYRSYATAEGIGVQYNIVPEPATATLSLLALAGLCARRRRK